jgi:hypothetical protein
MLPPGVASGPIGYHVSGGPSTPPDATVSPGNAPSADFAVGGLLPGQYTIVLSSPELGGGPASSRGTAFTVLAGRTSAVVIALSRPPDGGQPSCPNLEAVSVSPAEVQVGTSGQVLATASRGGSSIGYAITPVNGAARATVTSDPRGDGSHAVVACLAPGQVRLVASTNLSPIERATCRAVSISVLINCEPNPAFMCASGQARCGEACVSIDSDTKNCGSCGHVCGADETCHDGLCSGGTCPAQAGCDALLAANSAVASNTTCTETELTLWNKTIPGGKPNSGACLKCALNGSCLDDKFGDFKNECEDLAKTDAGPDGVARCLAALHCYMGVGEDNRCNGATNVPAPSAGISFAAYCGPGLSIADCEAKGPQGACIEKTRAGFPAAFSVSKVIRNFSELAFPGGVAGELATCLNLNCGMTCYP